MKTKGKPNKDVEVLGIEKDVGDKIPLDKPQTDNFSSFDNLRRFFDKVKSIGIIERIFGWRTFVSLSYDAYNEFKSFETTITDLRTSINSERSSNSLLNQKSEQQKDEKSRLERELEDLKGEYDSLSDTRNNDQKALSKYKTSDEGKQEQLDELNKKYGQLEFKYSELTEKNKDNEKKLAGYNATEEERGKQYDEKVNTVNQLFQQLEEERKKVQLGREEEIRQEFERKKKTWNSHERIVEIKLKEICSLHGIEYLDKEHIPFKGKPDNTVKIAGEFVIFDAKSPMSDDLTNFPGYIKQQAEAVKKYVKEEKR